MLVPRFNISLKPGKQILYIIPFGDIQGEAEKPRFRQLVQWCVDRLNEGHKVFLFGTGDYFETTSPSERASLISAKGGYGLHDTTLEDFDALAKRKADDFVEMVKPIKKHIKVIMPGHHFHRFTFGDRILTTDQYIAEALDAEYCGEVTTLSLWINGLPFRIFATHGFGTGRTKGTRINKRLRMREVVMNANWYVMAHDNEKMVNPEEPLIILADDSMEYFKQYFTGVGSFQRGYSIGERRGSYVEVGLYPPAVLGVVMMMVTVDHSRGKPRLDYHASS